MLKSARLHIASLLLICSPAVLAWTQCETASGQQVRAWSEMIKGNMRGGAETASQDVPDCTPPTEAQLAAWRDALDYWSTNRKVSSEEVLDWAVKTGLSFPSDENVDFDDLRLMRYNAKKVATSLYNQTQKAAIDLYNLQNGWWHDQPYEQFADKWLMDGRTRSPESMEAQASFHLAMYQSINPTDWNPFAAYQTEYQPSYLAALDYAHSDRMSALNSRRDAYLAQNADAIQRQQAYVASLTQQLNEAASSYRYINNSSNNAYRVAIRDLYSDGIPYSTAPQSTNNTEQSSVGSQQASPTTESTSSPDADYNRMKDRWSEPTSEHGMYR